MININDLLTKVFQHNVQDFNFTLMSDTSSDSEASATEHTALMDGHIAEARPDKEIAERIARKRKTKTESQRNYGVGGNL